MLNGSVEATIAIVFGVVALGPIIAERLRIPGLVGLIAGGVIFGPFVVGWLDADGLVGSLGAIGILVLMFLAGLSFDIRAFSENRRMAITYGLLGFVIPFVLASTVIWSRDDVEPLGALLIGAMWASNTLVAYPEVQAAGLQSTRSVGAAVSAGVVADLLSLTVLALATSTVVIEIEPRDLPFGGSIAEVIAPDAVEPSTPDPALPLWIGLPLLVGFCLWVLPRVARWFFVRVGRTRPQRVVFTIALMGAGSLVALLGGMEGLIGAFLAGLGLNRQVPTHGPLMERLDFTGTTIFVPVFLVSIGLSIDPALLIDPETIQLGLLFTAFVVVGKSAAAIITGLINRLDLNEIGIMSSLSFGQAASTLAIAEVGSQLDMFGQNITNAAVLAIVITAFVTSLSTRWFARRITPPVVDRRPLGEQILLDTRAISSDQTSFATLAARIAEPDGGVVRPYGVSGDGPLDAARANASRLVDAVAALGLDAEAVVRVDDSFEAATSSLTTQVEASAIMLDWSGPKWVTDIIFESDVDGVGRSSTVPAIAAHVIRPWDRVIVDLRDPDTSWQREDAELATAVGRAARGHSPRPLVVLCGDRDLASEWLTGLEEDELVTIVDDPGERGSLVDELSPNDLVVAPAHVVRDLPPFRARRFVRALEGMNVVVVAGPHRLALTQSAAHRRLSPTIGPAPEV